MERDPWDDILHNLSQSDDQPEDNPDIRRLEYNRNDLGSPYEDFPLRHPSTELGEDLYGSDEKLTAALQIAVFSTLQRKPVVAYNPGSGERATMALAFPGSRVIFTDISSDIEHQFAEHNSKHPERRYEFYRADMHDFRLPGELRADVTLILNAIHMTEAELDNVTSLDGLVIINDWHEGAHYMLEHCPGYTLQTRIDMGMPEDDLYVFQRQLRR